MRAIYAALLGVVLASDLKASQIAFDTAGDSEYNNMPANPAVYPNGGYGWGGPWQSNGLFINTPGFTGLGGPEDTTLINSPATPGGRAWGLPFYFQGPAFAIRPFAGALTAGQTFSIDLEMWGTVTPYGSTRADVTLNDGVPAADGITIEAYNGANPDYRVYVQHGQQYAFYPTGVPLTDNAVHIEVGLLDSSTARVSISSLSGDGLSAAVTFNDVVPITQVKLDSGGGPEYTPADQTFFNNIAITPEPLGVLGFSLGVAFMALRRCRRGMQ